MVKVRRIWSQQLEHKQVKKGGRNQVSRRVSVPCLHATTVANAPWKPVIIRWRSSSVSKSCHWWKVLSVGKLLLVKGQNFILHSWDGDFILLDNIPVSTIKLPAWQFKRSTRYSCFGSLLEGCLALIFKHSYEEQARAYRISWELKTTYAGEERKILLINGKFVM